MKHSGGELLAQVHELETTNLQIDADLLLENWAEITDILKQNGIEKNGSQNAADLAAGLRDNNNQSIDILLSEFNLESMASHTH